MALSTEQEVERLLAALAVSERERSSERTGRIRAEQALRAARATAEATACTGEGETAAAGVFPLVPIGYLRSCFSQRNGTPRQPLLVQQARATLQLAAHVSPSSLDGLAEFSHCWVLYVFHVNTDLDTRLGMQSTTRVAPGKVHVPRLNGAKRGVLATRSPHRPCPLGLSVGRVLAVDGRTITFGGLDVVDGTPVLDVKPYLPFCDAVHQATAPHWAQAEVPDGEEPLAVESVGFAPGAQEAVSAAWEASRKGGRGSLFATAAEFVALVQEALCRDIRSAHQRQRPAGACDEEGTGFWRVLLDGVNVGYSVDDGRSVTITDAHVQVS